MKLSPELQDKILQHYVAEQLIGADVPDETISKLEHYRDFLSEDIDAELREMKDYAKFQSDVINKAVKHSQD